MRLRRFALVVLIAAGAPMSIIPAGAQQQTPTPSNEAQSGTTDEEEAGTRGIKGRPSRPPPSSAQPASKPAAPSGLKPGPRIALPPGPGVGPSTGGTSTGGTTGTSTSGTTTGRPDGNNTGLSGDPPVRPGSSGTETAPPPPQGATVQPGAPIRPADPPGTIVYYPPGLWPSPPPSYRPQTLTAPASKNGVRCEVAGNSAYCFVDENGDGVTDPNTGAYQIPPGGSAIQVGDFVFIDRDGDGVFDVALRGTLVTGVPVPGTGATVDTVKVTGMGPEDPVPPGSQVDIGGTTVSAGAGGGAVDFTGDGRPDYIINPARPDGSSIRVVDIGPTNGKGQPGAPPSGTRPPGGPSVTIAPSGVAVGVIVVPFAPFCEEPGLEVLPRLDCLRTAFKAGRFGEKEYEERKLRALTLVDAPRMGVEQALRALNDALRQSLISQNNYYLKVNQVISRL